MVKLCLTVLLVLFVSFGTAASTLAELPEDHWIYDAIASIAASDHLPNIELKLDDGLTRYEAAMVVASFIQHIEQREPIHTQRFGVSKDMLFSDLVARYNQRVPQGQGFTTQEIDTLHKLTYEFHSELRVLGYSFQDLGNNNASTGTIARRIEEVFLAERQLMFSEEAFRNATRGREVSSTTIGEQSIYGDLAAGESLTSENGEVQNKSLWISSTTGLALRPPLETWESLGGQWQGVLTPDIALGAVSDQQYALDNRVPFGEDFSVGASYQLDEEGAPIIASVGGQLALLPELIVEGQYSHNTETQLGAGLMQLGATVRLGELEVGGSYRARQQGYQELDSDLSGEGHGYGFSLKLGDLAVSTARDQVEEEQDMFTTTSFDLSYGLPNSMLLRAEYRQVESELKTLGELGTPTTASVGLDIPIPQGRLRLGVSSEMGSNSQSDNIIGPSSFDSDSSQDLGTRKTASVGLSYLLEGDASLQLNYKLIDFDGLQSSDEQKSNVAVAEFSIKF